MNVPEPLPPLSVGLPSVDLAACSHETLKIDERDLVPGCYVYTSYYENRPARVTEVRYDGYTECRYSDQAGDFCQSIDKLRPIPLSVDWLQRLGMKSTFADLQIEPYTTIPDELADESLAYPGWELLHRMEGAVVMGAGMTFFYCKDVDEFNAEFRRISYVHQLQTLIWNLERVWLSSEWLPV